MTVLYVSGPSNMGLTNWASSGQCGQKMDECCNMADQGCCVNEGQKCYTVWEKQCQYVNKPQCQTTYRTKCANILIKGCRKKDIFQDLSRLKDHYQETINSLKTKYEETKILLSLRDQELAVLRRRNHKQDIMEIDSEPRKDSVESIDTVDENDVE